ncbi:MAG: hypothetical protein R6V23_07910 [Bacteroidales bacterium]
MNFGKISTFTSGVLALASQKNNDLEIDFIQPAKKNNIENIIVLNNLSDTTNYDHLLSTVTNMGFEVIISDCISELFAAKASNNGILTIEVSKHFLQKIVRLSKKLSAKIFVDLKGQEVMIVNSGEKEFFKMSDYHRQCYENGKDDVEYLYDIYDNIEHSKSKEDAFDYITD